MHFIVIFITNVDLVYFTINFRREVVYTLFKLGWRADLESTGLRILGELILFIDI